MDNVAVAGRRCQAGPPPSPHIPPGFYCGGGYGHVYCVALGWAPRRSQDYASGALGRAPCIAAKDGSMRAEAMDGRERPTPSTPPRYEPRREMRARTPAGPRGRCRWRRGRPPAAPAPPGVPEDPNRFGGSPSTIRPRPPRIEERHVDRVPHPQGVHAAALGRSTTLRLPRSRPFRAAPRGATGTSRVAPVPRRPFPRVRFTTRTPPSVPRPGLQNPWHPCPSRHLDIHVHRPLPPSLAPAALAVWASP